MTNQPPLDDEEQTELVAYLDGELDAEAARVVEAKIHRDPEAQAEAEALRRTWDLLDFLPQAQPSPSFTHRTLDRVSALRPTLKTTLMPRRRRWGLGLGWAAAVLLVGAAGFAGMTFFYPKPSVDEDLIRDLRLIENKRYYDQVDDLDFLRELDHPELFGEDNLDS